MTKTPEEMAEEFAEFFAGERRKTIAKKSWWTGYQAAAPQWISVKDRWPKDGEAVLITEGINVGICKAVVVQFKGHARLGWEKRFDTGDTSHWMPLPKPPEEDK
jgi:hypothetical protein